MKYEVIARRYRPRKFEEVVGQESVAQTLRGGILQDRMAHAYLFCGPRGVGKTSMARIFAKALNCPRAAAREGDPSGWARPCDECSVCEAIHTGQDIDVIEMDGASHRGIDDIRQLIEGVSRPASRGRYKVYLIDEVHMLTREAFNALLKTLEEPPSHVKFVFATTEPHKIPETVLSRCQRFDFHPIGEEAIVRRLQQICESEGRETEGDVLERIARYSRGGLRDSQTLLDQLMTFCEGTLSIEELDRITGRVSEGTVRELVHALLERRPGAVLERLRECFGRGADPAVLLEQVIEALHGRLLEVVEAARERKDAEGELDRVLGSLQILLETATRLRSSAYPDIAIEVALLKLARLEDPREFERALARLVEIERRGGGPPGGPGPSAAPADAGRRSGDGGAGNALRGPPPLGGPASRPPEEGAPPEIQGPESGSRALASSTPPPRPESLAREGPPPATSDGDPSASTSPSPSGSSSSGLPEAEGPGLPDASPLSRPPRSCDFSRLSSLWEQVLVELQAKHPDIAPFLRGVRSAPGASPGDTLILRFPSDFAFRQMRVGRRRESCEALIREVTGEGWKVRLEHVPEGDAAPPGPSRDDGVSGALPVADAREAAPAGAGAGGAPDLGRGVAAQGSPGPSHPESLRDHPLVKKTIELFHARWL